MRRKMVFWTQWIHLFWSKVLDQKVDLVVGNSEPCNSLHQVLYIINFDSFGRNNMMIDATTSNLLQECDVQTNLFDVSQQKRLPGVYGLA